MPSVGSGLLGTGVHVAAPSPPGAQPAVLGSLRITLSPLANLSLPGNGGEALHGLLLAIIGRRAPDWADRLHGLKGPKPFSISPLETCQRRDGRSLLAVGQAVSFHAVFLDTDLLGQAMAALHEARLENKTVPLGRATVVIGGVERDLNPPVVSFHDLLAGAGDARKILLEFLSPTAFKVGDHSFPFPLSELVFASLLRHWAAVSPVAMPPGLDALMPSIMVARHELRTELLQFHKFKAIGFTGTVVYELPDEMPDPAVRALNCLADFAFYSGVGWKTTMGMGQTRRIDHARPLPRRAGSGCAK